MRATSPISLETTAPTGKNRWSDADGYRWLLIAILIKTNNTLRMGRKWAAKKRFRTGRRVSGGGDCDRLSNYDKSLLWVNDPDFCGPHGDGLSLRTVCQLLILDLRRTQQRLLSAKNHGRLIMPEIGGGTRNMMKALRQ